MFRYLYPSNPTHGSGDGRTRYGRPRVCEREVSRGTTPEPGANGRETSPALWQSQILSQNPTRRIWLLPELVRVFVLHIVLNMEPTTREGAPLLFALNGPCGVGKTSSIRELAHRLGMPVVTLDATELESSTAHVPVQRIQQRYIEASELQRTGHKPALLLMNDADLVFAASESKIATTINLRLVAGTLMAVCDDPHHVGGKTTDRVVVAITCNTLAGWHGALVRQGRMRVFAMQPSRREVRTIVTHMFRGALSIRQARQLVAAHPAWSVATFAQVRSVLLELAAYARYQNLGLQPLQERIMRLPDEAEASPLRAFTDRELRAAVRAVEEEQRAKRDFTGQRSSAAEIQ